MGESGACAVRAGCILRDQTDNGSFATASPGTPTGAVRQAVLWRLSAHEAVRRPPCVTGTSVREPASCESAGGADLRRATADSRPQLGGPFRRSRPCNPSGLPASQLTPVPQLGSESSDKISSMDGAGQRLPRAAHDEGGLMFRLRLLSTIATVALVTGVLGAGPATAQGQPETKDDCKNGGWMQFGFKNQGQCIRFVNTGQGLTTTTTAPTTSTTTTTMASPSGAFSRTRRTLSTSARARPIPSRLRAPEGFLPGLCASCQQRSMRGSARSTNQPPLRAPWDIRA